MNLRRTAEGQRILQQSGLAWASQTALAEQVAQALRGPALALALMRAVRGFRYGAEIAAKALERRRGGEVEGREQTLGRGQRDGALRQRDGVVVDEGERFLGSRQSELLCLRPIEQPMRQLRIGHEIGGADRARAVDLRQLIAVDRGSNQFDQLRRHAGEAVGELVGKIDHGAAHRCGRQDRSGNARRMGGDEAGIVGGGQCRIDGEILLRADARGYAIGRPVLLKDGLDDVTCRGDRRECIG